MAKFDLFQVPNFNIDTSRLEVIAKDHLPLAAFKDSFNVSRDELWWLMQQANNTAKLEADNAELKAKLKVAEADARRWDNLANLWLAFTEITLTQNEDGGYTLNPVEAVDNIIAMEIHGDTPDAVIDQITFIDEN